MPYNNIMLLGFKTKLKLNNKQLTALAKYAGVALHAWNWGLMATKFVLVHDLRMAWERCFKKTSKLPRFKKKGKHDAFELDGTIKIRGDRKIQVPVIGIWRTIDNSLGIDLGSLRFATLSDGQEIDSPRPFQSLQQKLAKLQWRNRLKQVGSTNRKKAQTKIARLHNHIANIRKDFLHKVTTNLAKNHSEIVIEELTVSGMLANGRLSKATADSGFYEFRRQLEYKTKLHGSKLVLVGRSFPSSKTCSSYGKKKDSLSLSERTFGCECGFICDRDVNAAINLVRLVKSEFKPGDKKELSPLVESGSFCIAISNCQGNINGSLLESR